MKNKLIYWIPIVGVFFSLVNYKEENDMGGFWPFYQAVFAMGLIWLITYLSLAK